MKRSGDLSTFGKNPGLGLSVCSVLSVLLLFFLVMVAYSSWFWSLLHGVCVCVCVPAKVMV